MRKYRSPRYRKETPEKPENFVNDKREYYRKVYLKSDHWKDLRSRKIKSCSQCEKCSQKTNLDVHHLNYKNLYDVELEDLQVLCRKCHTKEHQEEREQKRKKQEELKTKHPLKKKIEPEQIVPIYDFEKEVDKFKKENNIVNLKPFYKKVNKDKPQEEVKKNLTRKQRRALKSTLSKEEKLKIRVEKRRIKEAKNEANIQLLLESLKKKPYVAEK